MFKPLHPLLRQTGGGLQARTTIPIIILVFVLFVAIIITLTQWRQSDLLHQIRERGVIRIGYAVEVPYAFVGTNTAVTGIDPEVAKVIASRLGIKKVEWRLTEFGTLIAGLDDDQYDVVAAGMFITPERQQRVAFSRPTFQARPALLVQTGNPHHLHSYLDIVQNPSVRVAVICGSVEEDCLLKQGFPAVRLMQVPDARTGRILVDSAQADALALSAPTIRSMIQRKIVSRAEMAEPFEEPASLSGPGPAVGGFAFRKEDDSLREAWDWELGAFVGSKEHLQLISQFGFTAHDLPVKIIPNQTNP